MATRYPRVAFRTIAGHEPLQFTAAPFAHNDNPALPILESGAHHVMSRAEASEQQLGKTRSCFAVR